VAGGASRRRAASTSPRGGAPCNAVRRFFHAFFHACSTKASHRRINRTSARSRRSQWCQPLVPVDEPLAPEFLIVLVT